MATQETHVLLYPTKYNSTAALIGLQCQPLHGVLLALKLKLGWCHTGLQQIGPI